MDTTKQESRPQKQSTAATVEILLACPLCKLPNFSPRGLRSHRCDKARGKPIPKQDWFWAVDAARVKAGLPEMVYGFDVTYQSRAGCCHTFHCATESETKARRMAISKPGAIGVISLSAYTYRQYVAAFGIPGSKM